MIASGPITQICWVTDDLEGRLGLSKILADSDKDNVSDGNELLKLHTNPLLGDSDKDRVPDPTEFVMGTDPMNPDTNRDGRLDGDIRPKGTGDFDDDGLTNELEKLIGSDPTATDSDNDGFTDFAEYQAFFNPADPASNPLASPTDPTRDPLAGSGSHTKPVIPVENSPDSWGLGDLDAPTG